MDSTRNEYIYIPARPNEALFSLYEKVTELEPELEQGMDKNAITERALKYMDALSETEFEEAVKRAKKKPIECRKQDLPTSFKVKEQKALVDRMVQKFKDSLNITKLQWLFFLKVVLNAYYIHLLEERYESRPALDSDDEEREEAVGNLLRFYLSVKISDMLLHNMPEDEVYIREITEIMNRRTQNDRIDKD